VAISGEVHNNAIGVALDGSGAANRIAFNKGDGVRVYIYPDGLTATGNTIRRNSIYSNGGLGINLQVETESNNTVTTNDSGDGDGGPNNQQNFPVLTEVAATSTTTTVSGTLNSTPAKNFKIDFYRNPAKDPSNFGEGKVFIGSTTVTTKDTGRVSFQVTLQTGVPVGEFVTATATNIGTGDTSEFSHALAAVAAATSTASSTKVARAVRDNSTLRLSLFAGSRRVQ
jgi:hypothetical protein